MRDRGGVSRSRERVAGSRERARTLRRLLRQARPDVRELDVTALTLADAELRGSWPLARRQARGPRRLVGSHDLTPNDLAPDVQVREPVAAALPSTLPHREPARLGREAVAVSRDLLRRLDQKKLTARGKHFAFGKLPENLPPATMPPGRSKAKPGKRLRKAYKEHKVPGDVLRQTMTVWDLILPLLHPPLGLDEGGGFELPHPLYHYQVDGIRFLCGSRSALLADEMGTGKTVMSTVALRVLFREGKVKRALVVCPLSVVGVWDRHLKEWAPELSVTVVHGSSRTRWADWRCPAHVWVTTFDTLRADVLPPRRDVEPLCPRSVQENFDVVLLDEAQAIKNRDSGRTRAVLKLDPKFRWALSGTPVENRLADLQSLFDFVRPRLLPDEGLTPEEASDLVGPYVKRRTKKDVMKELPPKIRQDEWLEMDPEQRRSYKTLEEHGVAQLEDLGDQVTRVHLFTLIGKLKMHCNFGPNAKESPKLRATIDKVEEIRDSGKKVLIFTQFIDQGVDRIAKALEPYGVVTFDARLSQPQREAVVQRFRADPDITAFVATVKSAGVGLTLTEASYVIHFDHWWNPAWMWQAEDRAHRRGQTEPVNVYSLWMADSIEERIYELLSKKGVLHEQVIDGLSEDAVAGMVSVEEWMSVLRPKK